MTNEEGGAVSDQQPAGGKRAGSRSEPHRTRIPGFDADTEVGLGDVIKRAASLAGLRQCRSCGERAARLNRWMVFSGRR
jgi:hypothetical protein